MVRRVAIDASPPINRFMKDGLDKDAFRKTITVLAARVPPSKTGSVLKSQAMRGFLMDLPKIRSVVYDPSHPDGDRLVLLRVSEEAALTPDVSSFLKEVSNGLTTYTLTLDYDYWTADEILQAVLPEELCDESPTGFAITGHLAHLNLNKQYLPYKYLIGQIILDKNKNIRTVVNKLDKIDNQFRFFKMELLAGDPDYVVEQHESNCRFTFDFTEVYWNSRLHTEHERLVALFKPEDVIADVFAGVGPFAVPAAKKGCAVLANDLNPNSAKYLSKNASDNKVAHLMRISCEDGRSFIPAVVSRALQDPFPAYAGPKLSRSEEKANRKLQQQNALCSTHTTAKTVDSNLECPTRSCITHFVLNLPDSAIEFLDAFRGIFSSARHDGMDLDVIYTNMPMVHCHCFTRECEPDKAREDIRQRVEQRLGHALTESFSLHMVRSVAPNKDMYCMSFRLPHEVAFAR
ncbi:hypothetical protein SERLA73DRAFT_121278 [Serpula lacrymans var. lacrymans S7.3]|uniref:tRNA (guanine(37)-N1)-methyltransferase n=2 Tax=Serpula lacrymans var. lacrymans TaxID=341189 RepID=F8PT40_SERL3|nr:hypothetical protein SERLA73DRAFT_121278 [Serpula lacrymans var. lacrymans S7.3]